MKLSCALLGLSSFAAARNNWRTMWVADTWLAKTLWNKLNDFGEVLNLEERILAGFPAEVATVDQRFEISIISLMVDHRYILELGWAATK